jgi:hypothetical protein
MKNYKSSMLQATFLIATIIGTSSCMNQTPEDTKAVAEQKNEQRFDNKNNKKDAQFLVDAAETSLWISILQWQALAQSRP